MGLEVWLQIYNRQQYVKWKLYIDLYSAMLYNIEPIMVLEINCSPYCGKWFGLQFSFSQVAFGAPKVMRLKTSRLMSGTRCGMAVTGQDLASTQFWSKRATETDDQDSEDESHRSKMVEIGQTIFQTLDLIEYNMIYFKWSVPRLSDKLIAN